jgi:hypothetical protein
MTDTAPTVSTSPHVVYPCECGALPGIHAHHRTRSFIAPTPQNGAKR